jgi:integrase
MNDFSHQLIDVQCPDNNEFTTGKKQWDLLQDLESKYGKKDISGITSNKFDDPIWELGENEQNSKIFFEKYLPSDKYRPMQMYFKILTIHLISIEGSAPSNVAKSMTTFMKQLLPVLQDMASPVLTAARRQPWLSLSELEPLDIVHALDRLVMSNGRLDKGLIYFLDSLERLQYLEDVTYFSAGFITPWKHERTSAGEWLNQFQKRHSLFKEKKPYSSLTDETIAQIIKPSMQFLEGLSVNSQKDIEMTSQDLKAPIVSVLRCIREKTKRLDYAYQSYAKYLSRDDEFVRLLKKHDKIINSVHSYREYKVNKPEDRSRHNTIQISWFTNLFKLSQTAAVWVVALTTGLRNVDIRNLRTDCLSYSTRFQMWYIRADLKKTNNTIYIPVGEPTVKAIKLLNWLRFSVSSDYLIQSEVFSFASEVDKKKNYFIRQGGTLNRRFKEFANKFNISLETVSNDDEEATCHCIRATLAGYIGRHSNLAVLILKKLFGHSNNLMPDQYIRHNVFVKKQREQQLEKMHSDTAHQIATSIVNKEVAGTKGEELSKGAAYLKQKIELEFDSLTEMDVHKKLIEVLHEIILNDIKNEQTQTLLTPMGVICMRATNHSADSPCAATINKAERDKAGVSRAMLGALPQLPNPAQCIGLDCPDALATKTHSLPLLEQFDWYTNVYRQCTDENRDMSEDAMNFVETYYPIVMENDMLPQMGAFRKKYSAALRQLYADIKPKGYFDV